MTEPCINSAVCCVQVPNTVDACDAAATGFIATHVIGAVGLVCACLVVVCSDTVMIV